jgi:hypothetical protein
MEMIQVKVLVKESFNDLISSPDDFLWVNQYTENMHVAEAVIDKLFKAKYEGTSAVTIMYYKIHLKNAIISLQQFLEPFFHQEALEKDDIWKLAYLGMLVKIYGILSEFSMIEASCDEETWMKLKYTYLKMKNSRIIILQRIKSLETRPQK